MSPSTKKRKTTPAGSPKSNRKKAGGKSASPRTSRTPRKRALSHEREEKQNDGKDTMNTENSKNKKLTVGIHSKWKLHLL